MLPSVFHSLKGNAKRTSVAFWLATRTGVAFYTFFFEGQCYTYKWCIMLLCGFRVSDFCAVGVLAPPDGMITEDALAAADVVVFGYPTHLFGEREREVLWDYVQRGGSILVLSGEGGDRAAGTTLSFKLRCTSIQIRSALIAHASFRIYRTL
jgi:hypothetical protein